MDKALELKKLFKSIDINNKNELLKWFALAYYYNDSLVETGVYDEVYKDLSTTYKPITEDINALQSLKDIKEGNKRKTITNMSYIIIEQIMIGLKGGIGLDRAVRDMLFNYHDHYNKEFVSELYMKMLKERIGDKVYLVGRYDMQPLLINGILKDVSANNSVNIDDETYNFIGYQYYIKSIYDENKKVLFFNTSEYPMNELIDSSDIETAKKHLFAIKSTKKHTR